MSDSKEREASRELDAEIATRLMGWESSPVSNTPWQLIPPGADRCIVRHCPHFSTDIAAAFLALENLNGIQGVRIDCLNPPNEFHPRQWSVEFIVNDTLDCVEADTLPLAICLAALAAIDASAPSSRSTTTETDNG